MVEVKTKTVKLESGTVDAGVEKTIERNAVWTPEEDVTIVGIQICDAIFKPKWNLKVWITKLGYLPNGSIRNIDQDEKGIWYYEFQDYQDQHMASESQIIFPKDAGIHVDKGDTVYIHVAWFNGSGAADSEDFLVTFYYVEGKI